MAASASGIKAGRAYVEIGANDGPLRKSMKLAEARLRAFGASVATIGKGFQNVGGAVTGFGAKLVGVGLAATAGLGATVKAASDLEEQISATRATFGGAADFVIGSAQQMADSFGIVKSEFLEAAAGLGAIFKASGFTADAAADMSVEYAKLAADLASFRNLSFDEALQKIRAGLVGEAEPLRTVGVLLSDAAVKTQAAKMGMVALNNELTEAQKVQARAAIISAQLADAQGDLARTADSTANQMRAAQGRVVNLAADIGRALAPAVADILGKLSELLSPVSAWIARNQELVKTIGLVTVGVIAGGAAFTVLGTALSGVGTVLGVVGTGLSLAASLLGAVASPIGLIVAGLATGIGLFLTWTDAGAQAGAALSGVFSGLLADAQAAFGGIKDALAAGDFGLAARIVWTTLKVEWQKGVNWLNAIWQDWGLAVKQVFSDVSFGISRAMVDMWAGIQGAWVRGIGVVMDLVNSFVAGIFKAINFGLRAIGQAELAIPTLGSTAEQRQAQLGQIESDRQGAQASITDQQAAADQQRRAEAQASLAAGDAELAKLQAELKASIAEASKAVEASKADPFGVLGGAVAGLADDAKAGGRKAAALQDFTPQGLDASLQATKRRVDVAGGFSASALRGQGFGRTVSDQQLETQKAIEKELRDLNRKARGGRLVFET